METEQQQETHTLPREKQRGWGSHQEPTTSSLSLFKVRSGTNGDIQSTAF